MRCTPAPFAAGALLALAITSSAAAQAPARTVARTTPLAADGAAAARALATPLPAVVRAHSALHYARLAGRHRLTGNSLVTTGAALVLGGLVHHFTQDRPRVMSPGSGAIALGGVATALYGVRHRDSAERAQLASRLWSATSVAAGATRSP